MRLTFVAHFVKKSWMGQKEGIRERAEKHTAQHVMSRYLHKAIKHTYLNEFLTRDLQTVRRMNP